MSDLNVTLQKNEISVEVTVPSKTVELAISGVKGDTGATGPAGTNATVGIQRYYNIVYEGGAAATNTLLTTARVYLQQIELIRDIKIDAIIVNNGGPVSGNLRVAIYGPVSLTTDTANGASLIVESDSVAQAGTNQIVSLTETTLTAGKYYIALQADNNTGFYLRKSSAGSANGLVGYYDRSGGYGAFTNPAPSFTAATNPVVGMYLRCSGTP
jgi:hypothetical protein